ncbi:hypothetical protein COU37_04635 [Candidatus Micrarchaeota archaeon CG10_big_fil_rev_8_21_14_0_10_45_29]|nr:MAG: hypothetical protein COU37_04635 [Candidatus Micrarchaeota archaeon CG10_big_fil_rev_8_21_14_0_10_45_29]
MVKALENTEPCKEINNAWKTSCKIIFGRDIGDLEDYEKWLGHYIEGPYERKSSLTGKKVVLSKDDFAQDAKYLSHDELDYSKKYEPLNINELKDIDSIANAIKERAYYTGNIVLGNSSNIEGSTDVMNSHFIRNCAIVQGSKFASRTRYLHGCEYCWGQYGATASVHAMMCSGSKIMRCLESHSCELTSDCYFCGSMQNSNDCMFSFGGIGKRNLIGNLQLAKEEYLKLKKKLVCQIADELEAKKKIYSLFSIFQECRKYPHEKLNVADNDKERSFDITPIQKAFSKTSKLLLGVDLGEMRQYEKWLYRHVPENVPMKSPFSGKEVLVTGYRRRISELFELEGRFLPESEMRRVADYFVERENVEGVDAGKLESVCKNFHKVAYSNLDKEVGKCVNCKGATVLIDAQDAYMGSAPIRSKQTAYSFWPYESEAIFGAYTAWESGFCINCYNCHKITRCLEVSDSHQCSDCYFSHNIENCNDCMFCFNVKNLRFAVGNVQLKPEEYKEFKKRILEKISNKLLKEKDLETDIFNLGAGKK